MNAGGHVERLMYIPVTQPCVSFARVFEVTGATSTMSFVLYIGGSRDGMKGFVPYGFSKTQTESDHGPEIYVERNLQVQGRRRVRVMALEALNDDIVVEQLSRHYD
jgi:hypothetical protein